MSDKRIDDQINSRIGDLAMKTNFEIQKILDELIKAKETHGDDLTVWDILGFYDDIMVQLFQCLLQYRQASKNHWKASIEKERATK